MIGGRTAPASVASNSNAVNPPFHAFERRQTRGAPLAALSLSPERSTRAGSERALLLSMQSEQSDQRFPR